MPHARQQIRAFVIAGLSGDNALPSTGDRVFSGRTRPLGKSFDPTLLIYFRSEPQSARSVRGAPPKIDRQALLHIEGRVSTADVPDDDLDQIALEVEQGLAKLIDYPGMTFFGGLVQNVDYVSTEIVAKADGERHDGGIQITYRITYRTFEGDPSAIV